MGRRSGIFAITFIALAMAAPAAANDIVAAGPQMTAAQILAVRGELRGPAYRIVMDKQTDDSPSRETITAIVTADYFEAIKDTNIEVVDLKLRRLLLLEPKERRFANSSLFAHVAFRVWEAENRHWIRGLIKATKGNLSGDSVNDLFWEESELGVMEPDEPHPHIEQTQQGGGDISFEYGGAEVARFAPSGKRIPKAYWTRFIQFMRFSFDLHPDIIDALASSNQLPQSLSYMSFSPVAGKHRIQLTLRSVEPEEHDYPLPADFSADPLSASDDNNDIKSLEQVFPIMLQAVAGRYGSGPRTAESYKKSIDTAMQQSSPFQALLLAFELSLQRGYFLQSCPATPNTHIPCHTFREIADAARIDPRGQALLDSLKFDQSNPERATELRRGIARDGLSNPYVVDVFLSNGASLRQKNGDEALKLHLTGIRGNPYVASFYKDLGDYYASGFDSLLAWHCYDLGRSLPERNRAENDPLRAVDQLEQKLTADFPQFF